MVKALAFFKNDSPARFARGDNRLFYAPQFSHPDSHITTRDVRTDVAVSLAAKVGRDPAIVKFGRHSSAGFSAEYNAD